MPKNRPVLNGFEYRKAPTDLEFHFIINQVKYVEELIANRQLAYDSAPAYHTIHLLAQYFRKYKGFDKQESESIIFRLMVEIIKNELGYDPIGMYDNLLKAISVACSIRKYKNCYGNKPLRDFDGITVTANEIETIKQLDDLKSQQLLFCILCFTKMYDETNRRQGRKVNHLYYVEDNVLRRCAGFKRPEKQLMYDIINDLTDRGFLNVIQNYDKYWFVSTSRQPLFTSQCNIVDDDSEPVLFIDNFDTLGFTWQFLLGDRTIKKCACGRYFKAKCNAQKMCPHCGYAKPIKTPKKTK